MNKPIMHIKINKKLMLNVTMIEIKRGIGHLKRLFEHTYDVVISPADMIDIIADNSTVVNINIDENTDIHKLIDNLIYIKDIPSIVNDGGQDIYGVQRFYDEVHGNK